MEGGVTWSLYGPLLPLALAAGMLAGTALAMIQQGGAG